MAITTITDRPDPLAIRRLRKALDLTQGQFALKLGVRANTIWRYEKGSIQPSARVLIALKTLATQSAGFLASKIGLNHNAVVTLMAVETGTDLLAMMATGQAELRAMEAELKARRQVLDEEEKRIEKEEKRLRLRSPRLRDTDDTSAGGKK